MKKKIILFSVLAIILLGMIIFLFAKIPSPQMDHKIFGSYFEKKICKKYELTFVVVHKYINIRTGIYIAE